MEYTLKIPTVPNFLPKFQPFTTSLPISFSYQFIPVFLPVPTCLPGL